MPTISRFYGISIQMYYAEHGVPHFHARYSEWSVVLAIESFEILAGSLPSRALRLVIAWAEEHRDELLQDWYAARAGRPLTPIAPLQ